jgi:hypothetical protein
MTDKPTYTREGGWLPRPASDLNQSPTPLGRDDTWLRAPMMSPEEQELARQLEQYQRDLEERMKRKVGGTHE